MAGAGQHVDEVALSELKKIMGDEFSTLVETFETDSVVRIEAITQAVTSAEPEEIRRAAHSFKGSAGNMGATTLTELCRTMEERGHQGTAEGCVELLEQIVEEYAHVREALHSLVKS